jgi:hypothetical protein
VELDVVVEMLVDDGVVEGVGITHEFVSLVTGVDNGTRPELMQEQAEEIRAGLDSQFEISSGRPVVAVFATVVYVAQKAVALGKRAVFPKALRQLSGWQSRGVGDADGVKEVDWMQSETIVVTVTVTVAAVQLVANTGAINFL